MSTSLIGPSLSVYAWPRKAHLPSRAMQYGLMPKQSGQAEDLSPVAINLRSLIAASRQRTVNAWAVRNVMVQSTVNRIVNGTMDPTVSMLEAIAKKFGLAAWQLLVPDLDPEDPPVLRSASAQEKALFSRLKDAMTELEKLREAGYTTPGDFDDLPNTRRFDEPGRRKA
jgi:transcriptional regulator with XRE-family HTH domain